MIVIAEQVSITLACLAGGAFYGGYAWLRHRSAAPAIAGAMVLWIVLMWAVQ